MEIFKKHPTAKGYSVSNYGKVNGVRRKDIGSIKYPGYKSVWIKGVGVSYVHRVVWRVFNGEIPDGYEINHKDGVKANNRLDNLELMTRSENIQHSYDVLKIKKYKGKEHWSYGKSVITSKETRKKMSNAKIGAKHPKFKGWYVIDGNEYESLDDAKEGSGINRRNVMKYCKEGTNNCGFRPLK